MNHKFSLIELLIVMAILAILSSLLSQSLSTMNYKAKAIVCTQKEHSISGAMSMFANDNEDRIPSSIKELTENDVTSKWFSWDDRLFFYDGREVDAKTYGNSWVKYDQSNADFHQLYACPMDPSYEFVNAGGNPICRRSYAVNAGKEEVNNMSKKRGVVKSLWNTDKYIEGWSMEFSQISDPSDSILLIERNDPQKFLGSSWGDTIAANELRDGSISLNPLKHGIPYELNFAMCDGSVRFMSFSDTNGSRSDINMLDSGSNDFKETMWDCRD
ncbi:MAG: prepilin-type N-terminal cleavage/methylation domain-containing protein [Planctomycetes bacterium]|nr:prepilin-type N-terminal cleavage/methylation domain-containing protein [Planctomycetota bacterium]